MTVECHHLVSPDKQLSGHPVCGAFIWRSVCVCSLAQAFTRRCISLSLIRLDGGQVRVEVRCTACGVQRAKNEIFTSLSLPLNEFNGGGTLKRLALHDLLELYFQTRELEYKCEHCDNNNVQVTPTISSLPNVLVRAFSFVFSAATIALCCL